MSAYLEAVRDLYREAADAPMSKLCCTTSPVWRMPNLVIPKDQAVQVNATVRKTSAGAADSIPVIRATNLARCLRDLQQLGAPAT